MVKRRDIGAQAKSSGIGMRKVTEESLSLEGSVCNDDRSDFKTKN